MMIAHRYANRARGVMLLAGVSGRGIRWRRCLARPFHGPRFAMTVPSAHIRANRHIQPNRHSHMSDLD